MQPRRQILLTAFVLAALAGSGPAWAADEGDRTLAYELPSRAADDCLAFDSASSALSNERPLMTYAEVLVPCAGNSDGRSDGHEASIMSYLDDAQGSRLIRRRFVGSRLDYDAGLVRSMFEGKLLGLGFRYRLTPSMSLSSQTGLGFTQDSPEGLMTFGFKLKF
jgi:hypothetical protein